MNTQLGKFIHRKVLENHPFFGTSADDFLKWTPLGAIALAKFLGVKTRTTWKREVIVIAATQGIRYLLSDNIKKLTQERRPAPYTGRHSFPSGHTCTAFAAAELMRSELKEGLPVLAYAGYLTATAVATIRIMKSRHWLRDVVAGAAIGIFSARITYLLVNKIARKKAQGKVRDAPVKGMQFASPLLAEKR